MTKEEFINTLKTNQKKQFSRDLNGLTVSNSDFLRILFNKHQKLDFPNWLETGKILSALDIRHQLFMKIEVATIHYFQSIESYTNDLDNIWNKTNELGYSKEFTSTSIIFGEVSMRTNFLEKVFFAIDYFIQQMNGNIKFHTTGSTHKKQQYFKLLLTKLGLEKETLETDEIVDDLISNIPSDKLNGLFVKGKNRKIEIHEFYGYFVAMRNGFHNNGFSQKTVNNLNIGGVIFDIQKDKQIKFGHHIVVTAVYLMLHPLKRIVEETFVKYPNQLWEDAYTKDLKQFMEEYSK
ncbi:hypothetical protein G1K57_12195 [Tenacibaculum finnmarkense]|uniref:hypothetical protein n=1 Tax=Tenacibaculum finnmarkense TaxID=2781243 RepID=UPI001EFA6BEE|nr:hypothetical protein [Tenacibaculum finnmarkense]MBE7646797.1 hypothetical protein [Tenacibaculum finnmarkense genomovar ulcerans]MCG8808896.1 hypothetical protein [Tenacibaculum finnmarkense]MCG8819136.1 hypothetical protein [Tenacibaculum finnmarkense]